MAMVQATKNRIPADDFPSKVPKKYLVDYNDIIDGKLDNNHLVDFNFFLTLVTFASFVNKVIKGKDNLRLLIELRDQNDVKLMCTLCGCYDKQVYDYSMLNMSIMIICLIRFCLLKTRAIIGAYSVFSGYNSTHIMLNPTLDLIDNFKVSLPNDSLALTNTDSSQWFVGSATSVRARFFVTNERLTIKEIIDSDLFHSY
ncbi:unnamed protein product [Eruca vesicaria subsp. sativa]|uniref:Uncharacterized protein n=1 Tax=Eruca vesicaria subsp. sativa TaxID=29727 RepID=A0ABC8KZF5_ERUVS|nr:unnamed protein product [Eruca vesicaria subsp. sativa]